MGYFLTGGTGFIGRHLIAELLSGGEAIYVLVRPSSRERLERIIRDCGAHAHLIVPVEGDLGSDLLGLTAQERASLRGKIRHFFHLGALYDLAADSHELERANVLGTRHALDFAHEVGAGCFHLVSSIAVAGRFSGTFTEEMFEEAGELDHPYFRTKHDSEALVRSSCHIPWRVYRPGMVVGHSRTGMMDKIDGPYYLFKIIQKIRGALPPWLPLIGFEGGHINLVPVDFVAAALAYLAQVPGQDGRCFHLTDRADRRIGEVLNLFAKAAHAPTMTLRLEPGLLDAVTPFAGTAGQALQPLRRIVDGLLRDLGVPQSVVRLLDYPTTFDARHAQALLGPAAIPIPKLEDYAWRLWDYWERHLDPDASGARNLHNTVQGKTVLITGGSSGIGRATAMKLAEAGAQVLTVARDPQKLADVRAQIEARGGRVRTYCCDITDAQACERFLGEVLAEHKQVDILINNAGRSIRRSVANSYGRFHDYDRLMQLNYFAAVRMTLSLLPAMVKQGRGHVISISSIGVLSSAARFAGYNASKAALEAFSRCAAAEYRESGVHFTVINMPLVRTPMVAPTKIYAQFALLSPEAAADKVCEAIVHRPDRLATPLGRLAQLVEAVAPSINTAVMSESFRMFPESQAAGGEPSSDTTASSQMVAFASLMRGIHW